MSDLDKLIPALILFQSSVPLIPKTHENPFFKNKETGKKCMYADLADILEIIKKPLTDNGLCISQPVEGEVLATYLYHSSGQFIRSEMPIMNEKKNIQGLGAALTYSRRYALCSILSIAADDDMDGNPPESSTAGQKTTYSTNTPPKQNKSTTHSPDEKLTYKKKNPDGTFAMVPLEELEPHQIEWVAKNSQDKARQEAASNYILQHPDKFNEPKS